MTGRDNPGITRVRNLGWHEGSLSFTGRAISPTSTSTAPVPGPRPRPRSLIMSARTSARPYPTVYPACCALHRGPSIPSRLSPRTSTFNRPTSMVPPARPQEQGSRTRAREQAQAQTQGCGVGAAGPEHGTGQGTRVSRRPPSPLPPCPTRYAAPPAGATTSSLDLALPAPHAPAQPATACLPRALLPLLPCSPCHATLCPTHATLPCCHAIAIAIALPYMNR